MTTSLYTECRSKVSYLGRHIGREGAINLGLSGLYAMSFGSSMGYSLPPYAFLAQHFS